MAVAEDKLNTLAIVTVGLASVLLLWASIVALQAYYANTMGDELHRAESEGQDAELRTLRAEQQARLKALRRNEDGATVRMPIERAQQLVVRELRTGAPESLVPAAGPHDAPTVPPMWGRPPDDARPPGDAEGDEAGEGEGDAAAQPEAGGEAGAEPSETDGREAGDRSEAPGGAAGTPPRGGADRPRAGARADGVGGGQEAGDGDADDVREADGN